MTQAPQILIADDEPVIREILAKILTSQGAGVTAVENGWDAVQEAQRKEYDLCILDVEMPVMGGLDACRLLRTSAFTKSLLVLFLTGRVDKETIDQAFEAGASDYLNKPIHPTLLKARVTNLLALNRMTRESSNLTDTLKLTGEPPPL